MKRPALLIPLALIVAGTLVWLLADVFCGAEAGPWWLSDHFTDLSKLNMSATTAEVDTAFPGKVRLAKTPQAVAACPSRVEYCVMEEGGIRRYVHDGGSMRASPEGYAVSLPGAFSGSYSETGERLFVAAGDFVRVYGFDGEGFREMLSLGVPGLLAVSSAGEGEDFFVLTSQSAMYYAWSGSEYSRVAPFDISGLSAGRALSASGRGIVMVLDGRTLRFFKRTEAGLSEVLALREVLSENPIGAGLSWDGSLARVLFSDRAECYQVGPDDTVKLPSFTVSLSSLPLAVACSPWAEEDFAVLKPSGVDWYSRSDTGWRINQALSVSGLSLFVYRQTGEVHSKIFALDHDIEKVRLEASYSAPQDTSVTFQVTTDGGATWTDVPLNENVLVPPGRDVGLKIVLSSSPARDSTPEVDSVDLFEIERSCSRAKSR